MAGPSGSGPAAAAPPVDRRFLLAASLAGGTVLAVLSVLVDALARRGAFGHPADALWVAPFHDAGVAMVAGQVPYRDFAIEYPPLSLPTFVLPALIGGADPESYRAAFEALMVVCGMALVPVVAVTVARLGGRRSDVAWAVAVVAAAPLLAGPTLLARYDLWPALLAAAAVAAVLHDRHRVGHALLALGVLAKVYPFVLAPFFVAWTWRRAGRAEALRAAAVGVVVGLACLLPFVALDPGGALGPFSRTFARPLQIETLGATVLIALHHLTGVDPGRVVFTFGSDNLAGHLADQVALGQSVLLLVALATIWPVLVARSPTPARLVLASAAAIAATVAFGKVLSPQYVTWLVPAFAVLTPVLGLRPLAALAGILVLTNMAFPGPYGAYINDFAPGPTAVLLVRNVVLVVLAVGLTIATWAGTRDPPSGEGWPSSG